MRKRTASGKAHPLAVIILAFFHRFSYHYGALSQKVLISCEIRTFSVLFCSITYLSFFLTQTLTPTGADSGKHYTAPERMLPIVFAASRLAEVVT